MLPTAVADPDRGSPAHAGIDPGQQRFASPLLGLPRTRGDRPETWILLVAFGRAPPAHAGIDPVCSARPPPTTRLPRTRGDRPGFHKLVTSEETAPPHTRG